MLHSTIQKIGEEGQAEAWHEGEISEADVRQIIQWLIDHGTPGDLRFVAIDTDNDPRIILDSQMLLNIPFDGSGSMLRPEETGRYTFAPVAGSEQEFKTVAVAVTIWAARNPERCSQPVMDFIDA